MKPESARHPPASPAGAAKSRRPRRGSVWTRERVRNELLAFVGDGKVLPTSGELNAAGRSALRRAMAHFGDAATWAAELGLDLRPGQDRRPYSVDDARRDIRAVVREVGRLPNATAIRRRGYTRLAAFVERHGGAACA